MDIDLRSPVPPWRPRAFVRWAWRFILDIVDEWQRDGVGDLAASITFWTVLSIPAAILAIISTLSSLEQIVGSEVADDVRNRTLGFIGSTFSDSGTVHTAVAALFDRPSTGVATVASLVAVFTLSRAFAGLIRALDRAYGVPEGRPWWYLRIVAVGLGLVTIAVIAGATVALEVLPALPFTGSAWLTVVIAIAGVVTWITTMFHLAPNHRTPWVHDLPGALVTTLGWLIALQGFSFYVRFSASGNGVQSSIGAVLLALTLLYALSIVLLIGAEINDIVVQRLESARRNEPITDRMRDWRNRVSRKPLASAEDEPGPDPTTIVDANRLVDYYVRSGDLTTEIERPDPNEHAAPGDTGNTETGDTESPVAS